MTLLLSVLQFTLWRLCHFCVWQFCCLCYNLHGPFLSTLCDTSAVCVTVYIVEIVVKILALGPHGYFSCGWNRSVPVFGIVLIPYIDIIVLSILIPCNKTLILTTSPSVSPLGIPVIRGEDVHDYHHLFLLFFFPHVSLIMFSINSLSFAVVPSLSRSLSTQSSHCILGLHCLLSPPLSGHLISFAGFLLLFFPHEQPISTYSSPISS